MRLRGLVLAALVLAPLMPLAMGAPPTPVPWSPYAAGSAVQDVAMAAEGATVAAALARPVSAPAQGTTPSLPGTNPSVTPGDLAILDAETGFAYNGTGHLSAVPQGRSHVAVSRDGSVIASVGLDATTNPTGLPTAQVLSSKLYYQRLASGARWTSSSPATNVSAYLTGNVTDLLLSADGSRMVVGLNDNGRLTVQGWRFSSNQLLAQFTFQQAGRITDLSATPDLENIAASGQLVEANETHGVLYHIAWSGTPVATLYDRSYNGSSLVSVSMAPDQRLFAGDALGRVHYAAPRSTSLSSLTLPGPAANVTLGMSEDGTRLAAATLGGALALLNTTGTPVLLWNTTTGGDVVDLALNRTGGLVLAAVNGTGAFAYGDHDTTVLWKLNGAVRSVAINAAGTSAAYSINQLVAVVTIPRSIAFEFPNGAKTGASVPIQPQGSATFTLQVRNPGASLERVRFEGPRNLDVVLRADAPIVAVAAGETRRVVFTATVGPSFSGTQSFNVSAISLTSGSIDNATLSLTLQTATSVRFILNGSSEITVIPGQRSDVLLGVVNNGSKDAALGLRATQQPTAAGPWNVTIDPPSFTLAPNTITTVRVTVTPPEDTQNGTANTLTFVLEGPEVSDSTQVVFRINPTLNVQIEASGRVKFVEPGRTALYNVTVTNTGSLPREFEAFFQATPTGSRNWAVDMDTSRFRLVPGDAKTVPVKIFAPADAAPNEDLVSVFIVARSIPELANETVVQSNLTLFARAVEPKPTTTTPTGFINQVPDLEPVIVLAVLGVLALGLRPRRRQP